MTFQPELSIIGDIWSESAVWHYLCVDCGETRQGKKQNLGLTTVDNYRYYLAGFRETYGYSETLSQGTLSARYLPSSALTSSKLPLRLLDSNLLIVTNSNSLGLAVPAASAQSERIRN